MDQWLINRAHQWGYINGVINTSMGSDSIDPLSLMIAAGGDGRGLKRWLAGAIPQASHLLDYHVRGREVRNVHTDQRHAAAAAQIDAHIVAGNTDMAEQ